MHSAMMNEAFCLYVANSLGRNILSRKSKPRSQISMSENKNSTYYMLEMAS
jgi:hypothetical protein